MDTTTIPPAGDPFSFATERARTRSTRHIRCDDAFLELLEEDFAIEFWALHLAFLGCPREPKKSAIRLCEWAAEREDPTRALIGWARKNRRGSFRPDYSRKEE